MDPIVSLPHLSFIVEAIAPNVTVFGYRLREFFVNIYLFGCVGS